MADYLLVLVTAPSKIEAEKISKAILSKKVCACVNMISGIKSLFHWEGKINNAKETLLVIKTKKSAYKDLEKIIKKNHSYTVPEIIAIPIVFGSSEYLNWIKETVK